MATKLIEIVLGLAGLWLGAELLVRGATTIARRVGVSALVTGLTVVALATSMPEFIVSLDAALEGHGNIAIGNAVGSNIANVGLILGVTALIHPIKVQFGLVRFDTPLMLAISLGFLYAYQDHSISRGEGVILFLLLLAYLTARVLYARKKADATVVQEFNSAIPKAKFPILVNIGFVIGGVALLAVGAEYLVDGASALARMLHISDAVIALTIVAIGTSTPELAASLVAAARKAPDLAAGNIVGSCIFNILGIIGLNAVISPIVSPGVGMTDIYAMCAMAALLLPMLVTGYKIARPEGAILLLVYCGYLFYLWPKV